MRSNNKLSRRNFLKLAGAGLGGLALTPYARILKPFQQAPLGKKYGRVSVMPYFFGTEIKVSPHRNAAVVNTIAEDTLVEWQREVIGTDHYSSSKRWVETPDGYVYAPHLQPTYYLPNTPLTEMPEEEKGFWAEVTVPFVDLFLENPPVRSPSFRYVMSLYQLPRLYYGQVVWIDKVKLENGATYYRFNEDPGHGYGYGDIFWADATAFRPLSDADAAPISPDVDPNEKRIEVNVTYQNLSCFEAGREVYFCRIASGVGDFSTPIGEQFAHWKTYSIHMSANTASDSGYDTPGVSWPTFINGQGVAIHGVFWHNDFGTRRSHGCINVLPEDAKWIFRWTDPFVSLEQSEIKMTWPNVGTKVVVKERQF